MSIVILIIGLLAVSLAIGLIMGRFISVGDKE